MRYLHCMNKLSGDEYWVRGGGSVIEGPRKFLTRVSAF